MLGTTDVFFPFSGVHRGETSAPDVGRSSGQVSERVSKACRKKINGSVFSSDSNERLVLLMKTDKSTHVSIHLTRPCFISAHA